MQTNMLAGQEAAAIGMAVADLAAVGVARISLGAAIAQAAYAVADRAARELLTGGTYSAVADAYPYNTLNTLLS